MPAMAASNSPLSTNALKTHIMIRAAQLMTRLVSAKPTRTARALSLVWTHSSCIRLTRKIATTTRVVEAHGGEGGDHGSG